MEARLYGIIGGNVLRSRSPLLHNGGYHAFNFVARYIPVVATVDQLDGVLRGELDGQAFAGLTVTSPLKERALLLADESDEWAVRCGAANLLLRTEKGWRAETTDPWGMYEPLLRRGIDVTGKRALVIGCGGAGRGAAAGLVHAGADVTLANRHPDRGRLAGAILGLPWLTLDRLDEFDLGRCDIIVNATTLGQGGEPPLFAPEALAAGGLVVDLVYASELTPLAKRARAAGCELIEGREIFLSQASRQFERMTGHAMSVELARELTHWSQPEGPRRGPDDGRVVVPGASGPLTSLHSLD